MDMLSRLKITALRARAISLRNRPRTRRELLDNIAMLGLLVILLGIAMATLSHLKEIDAFYFKDVLLYILVAVPALKLGFDFCCTARYIGGLKHSAEYEANVASSAVELLGKFVAVMIFYVAMPIFEKILGYTSGSADFSIASTWFVGGIAIALCMVVVELVKKIVHHELAIRRVRQRLKRPRGQVTVKASRM